MTQTSPLMLLYSRLVLVKTSFMLQADKNPQIDEAVWQALDREERVAGQIQVCEALKSNGSRDGVSYGQCAALEIHRLGAILRKRYIRILIKLNRVHPVESKFNNFPVGISCLLPDKPSAFLASSRSSFQI